MLRLLVNANVPGALIVVTLMMAAISSSETSVLETATRRNISEDGILHDILHAADLSISNCNSITKCNIF
jgi:hypothetical protein